MFRRPTLFIVGAGASKEFGFPIGTELAQRIALSLYRETDDETRNTRTNDGEFFEEIRRFAQKEWPQYLAAAARINEGVRLASSIDDFLDIHNEDKSINRLGKAAIVRAILKAERSSTLFVSQSNIYNKLDFGKAEGTWLMKLIRVLGPGVTKSNVARLFDNVGFIVFNYDRCIEQFLTHALPAVYGISRDEAAAIVGKVTIFHPFGTVGALSTVPFGGDEHRAQDDFNLSEKIKTYTEQIADYDQMLVDMRAAVKRARCVVFLGLSYGEQSMRLLRPEEDVNRRPIFGTALGMSESDSGIVTQQLISTFDVGQRGTAIGEKLVVLRTDLTCSRLFDEYARSLNAA